MKEPLLFQGCEAGYAVRRSFLDFGVLAAGAFARLFFSADIKSITGASRLGCSCLGAAWPFALLSISSFTRV